MNLISDFICYIWSKDIMDMTKNTQVRDSVPEDVADILLRLFPMIVTWRDLRMYSTLQYRASIWCWSPVFLSSSTYDWIFQLKDTNLGKYINLFGRILRVLNIDHIPHAILDAVIFDDFLSCLYLSRWGFLVNLVMAVELINFKGYTCAIHGHLGCGVRNTLAVRYGWKYVVKDTCIYLRIHRHS